MITGGVVRLTGDVTRELAEIVIETFSIKRYMDAVKVIERML